MEERFLDRIQIVRNIVKRGDKKNLPYLESEFEYAFEYLINMAERIKSELEEVVGFLIVIQFGRIQLGLNELHSNIDQFMPVFSEIDKNIENKDFNFQDINKKLDDIPVLNNNEIQRQLEEGERNINVINDFISSITNLKTKFTRKLNKVAGFTLFLRILLYALGGLISYWIGKRFEEKFKISSYLCSAFSGLIYTFSIEKGIDWIKKQLTAKIFFDPIYTAQFYEDYCRLLVYQRFSRDSIKIREQFNEMIRKSQKE